MDLSDLLYVLALQHIPNLGDSTAKKLIRHLGSSEAVLKSKKESLLKLDGIGNIKLKGLHDSRNLHAAQAELKFIQENNIRYHYYQDPEYPEKLKHCSDGPILLFSRGKIDLRNNKIISIVGTRNITIQGTVFCEKLIEELAPLDPVIISGFAYGVDITAQKAAVKNKLQTVGCLAHGLNQIYPKTHSKYVEQVEENGGFFTDFWSTNAFERTNFLKRNRIIAGLSEATIVIESAEKGGSLVTADIANSYNREVFAVPGRPKDLQSRGATVRAFDPVAMEVAKQSLPKVEMMQDAYSLAKEADALIVVTDWNEFKNLDLERIHDSMRQPVLVDGRNIYIPAQIKALGFTYRGVGRGYNGGAELESEIAIRPHAA